MFNQQSIKTFQLRLLNTHQLRFFNTHQLRRFNTYQSKLFNAYQPRLFNTSAYQSRFFFNRATPIKPLQSILFNAFDRRSTMATITLKDIGQKMPLVCFGTWKMPKNQAADTACHAIEHDYRLFHDAQDYTDEKKCGENVARAVKDGLPKREYPFIISKLCNSFHSKEHVKSSLKRVLTDWKVDYLGLFLIHFPRAQKYVDPSVRYHPVRCSPVRYPSVHFAPDTHNDEKTKETYYEKVPISETWAALEKCVKEGFVKNIGASIFNSGLIQDLLNTVTIRPAVPQIEHHPYLTQGSLVNFAQSEGIAMTAYSFFGPHPYVEKNNPLVKNLCLLLNHGTIGDIAKAHDKPRVKKPGTLLNHDTIGKIAKVRDKLRDQILLRWAAQRGIGVILKSNDEDRLAADLQIDGFDPTQEEFAKISALDINFRFNDPADWNPTPTFQLSTGCQRPYQLPDQLIIMA